MFFSTKLIIPLFAATASIVNVADANSTCENDNHFWFLTKAGTHKKCGWLGVNHNRQGRYCNKQNQDGVHIGTACKKACNNCASSCEDAKGFTFRNDNGESKSCDWLKDDAHRQNTYCSRPCAGFEFIGDACPESCNWCPTSAPTDVPTITPTAKPTVYPTATPTKSPTGSPSTKPTLKPTSIPTGQPSTSSCEDAKGFTFRNDYGEFKSCDWLKDDAKRQHTYCSRPCAGYEFIGDACPESCNWCPTSAPTDAPTYQTTSPSCDNDSSFHFKNDLGIDKKCGWLTDNKTRKNKYCDRDVNGVNIGQKCRKSCERCGGVTTKSPTASPVCNPSPSKGSATPSKGSSSPSKGYSSPSSPSKGSSSPSKGYSSPSSPSKGSSSPSKGYRNLSSSAQNY